MTWTLRPWRMSDAGALAALLQDGRVRRMLRDGLPYPYTEADARAFLAETLASDPEEVFAFAIAQEDIPVGSLGMFRQGNIHRRTAELGYYLGPDHWGQGIGTWAVREAVQWVFARTDLLESLRNPSQRTTPPAGCWRKRDSSWRGSCGRTQSRTDEYWI